MPKPAQILSEALRFRTGSKLTELVAVFDSVPTGSFDSQPEQIRAFLCRNGLQDYETFEELPRRDALAHLAFTLAGDIANDNTPIEPQSEAKAQEFLQRYLACFNGELRFFAKPNYADSLTKTFLNLGRLGIECVTFDNGIITLGENRIGLIWKFKGL